MKKGIDTRIRWMAYDGAFDGIIRKSILCAVVVFAMLFFGSAVYDLVWVGLAIFASISVYSFVKGYKEKTK